MSEIEPDAVECALDALGAAWKRREDGWVIAASAKTPCEIHVISNEDGVRIEGVLASWEGETGLVALTALLRRAEAETDGVRFEMRHGSAAAFTTVRDERGIGMAVGRIARVARLMGREAALLLLEPEMAERYLAFLGAPAETSQGPPRS